MAGYIGSKAVNLSTTGADINGDADVSGDLTVNTLHVDSTNNRVGIGTTSPSTLLDVVSASNPSMKVRSNGGTVGNYAELTLQSYNSFSGSGQAFIRGLSTATGNSNTDLVFGTNASGFGAPTERMRITAAGSVGIGTSSPSYKLDVDGEIRIKTNTNGLIMQTSTSSDVNVLRITGGNNVVLRDSTNSDALTIDSSGNVGIGTSSPEGKLHVNGQVKLESTGESGPHTYRSGNSGNDIRFFSTNGTFSSPTAKTNGSAVGQIHWSGYDGTQYRQCASVTVSVDGSVSSGNMPMRMGFHTGTTSSVERMRIDSSGNVLINKTSAFVDEKFTCNGGSTRAAAFGTDGTSNFICISIHNGNGAVGSITTSGSSTSYNTSSDQRLKENVVELTGATERLKQLNPSRFNFIADADTTVDGFLAHEVQSVVPEAITGTKDAMRDEEYEVTPAVLDDDGNVVTEAVMGTRSVPDYQGIDQSKLVPLLTAALQEALDEITDLKARVATLEAN
jgi:hypothetical protein